MPTCSSLAKLGRRVVGVEFKLRRVDSQVCGQVSQQEVRNQVVEGNTNEMVGAENCVSEESLSCTVLEGVDIHLSTGAIGVQLYTPRVSFLGFNSVVLLLGFVQDLLWNLP